MSQSVILVPLDGSESALSALPIARVLAELDGSSLRLVHVAQGTARETEGLSFLGRTGAVVEGLEIEICAGEPAAEILRLAEEIQPRVIVMCTHRAGGPPKVLGSTATSVLRGAPCPVVFVPPERGSAAWHLHHVIVPHDGTPTTSAALQPAQAIAERAGAELFVVHVTGVRPAPAEPGSLTAPFYVDQPHHEWPAWSSEFVRRLACMCPLGHTHIRMSLAHGDPAEEINRLAAEQHSDLMVAAWLGVWEAPRAAILKDFLGRAPCPVMVIRAPIMPQRRGSP